MGYKFGKNGMLKKSGPGKRQRAKAKARFERKIAQRKKAIADNPEKAERERQKRVAEYLAKQGTPTGQVQS